MRILDKLIAWLLVIFGMLHAAATFMIYKRLSIDAIWFFSGAIAIWFAAALNLLRISYADRVPALRWVALAGNLMMLALDVVIAAAISLHGNPQVTVLAVLLLLEIAFSLRAPYSASTARP